MLRKEKVNFISEELNKLYPKTPTPLTHQNKFELLIAVLLSAQCTDERVNKISPLLFKVANNPFEMEKISKEKIYSIIKPCGLGPQKSKAISELSKILVKEFNNELPKLKLKFCLLKFSRDRLFLKKPSLFDTTPTDWTNAPLT